MVQLVAHRLVRLSRPTEHVPRDHPYRTRANVAVAVWAGTITIGVALGLILRAFGRDILLLPPILAELGPGPRPNLVLPIATAVALILALPRLAERLRWHALLATVALMTLVWTMSLALAEGVSGLTRGLTWPTEYLSDVPAVRAAPGAFLRGFTRDIGNYSVHARGHPPGMVLLLAALDRGGLGGAGWAAAMILGAAATAPVAVMLALRDVAGETIARRSAPWLVLAPAAIWVATSADALYMAVGAWAVALVILATGRRGRSAAVLALLGGLLAGFVLLGSYGLVLLAAIPLASIWSRREHRWAAARTVLLAGAGAMIVLAALLPFGYSWLAGARATKHEYYLQDLDRPYWALLVVNLAAWALALGPATFVALAHLRDRRIWWLVGGGIAAAALANLSGLSAGEVERIWLPFTIWVLPAGAAFPRSGHTTRTGLTLQAASAIALISIVTTQW
ncbi:MAG TPA: hypothetical protein VGQ20_04645 [Acidimicrobiales bacterium]|nr:hypothetical protein [Acidimicrobiales bacterium]